jgi:hypothetical protein
MLSARNTTSAAAGGQRDSPRGVRDGASAAETPAGASGREITRQSCHNVLAPTHADGVNQSRHELAATVLLALATVATAWSAYQSRTWTGEQSQGYSHATAARIAVNREAAVANRQVQIDVATFIQWINAAKEHRPELAAFYRARFRDEFKPAFAAWLATKPFTNPAAPDTPFAMPEYRLKASTQADSLESKAAADSLRAKDANQRADNYMLAVVLFASSLFFAGISTKLETTSLRTTLLALGWVIFLGTVIWLVSFPVRLAT